MSSILLHFLLGIALRQ